MKMAIEYEDRCKHCKSKNIVIESEIKISPYYKKSQYVCKDCDYTWEEVVEND